MANGGTQFDGVNPVSGYTLFHGKDGQSYYLKGENLADDEITQRVATLRGQSADDITNPEAMLAKSQRQAATRTHQPLATATIPGERRPNELPTLFSRFAEATTGVAHPLEQIAGREIPMLAARPGEYAATAATQTAEMPARIAYQATHHPLDTSEAIMPANRAIGDVRSGQYGAAAGDIGGGILNAILLGKGAQSLPDVAEGAAAGLNKAGVPSDLSALPDKGAVARTFRTEKGALKPSVKFAGQAGGAAAGAGAGALTSAPYGVWGGGAAGYKLGPSLLNAIIPDLPEEVPLDQFGFPAAENTPGWSAKLPNRMPKPEVDEVTQAVRQGLASRIPTRMPKPAASTEPQIVSPSAGEPRFSGSEGRAATWTNEDVMRLAAQGNREAIQQAIRRGLPLPENVRYIMGDPDYPRAIYNPRETTTFTPEDTPIRNKAGVQASSKKRIAAQRFQTNADIFNDPEMQARWQKEHGKF